MSDRENDIEFDFFEESETTREAAAEERPRRRGQRPPVRPPTGLTPLLRLIGLISFAILIVLLLIFWVNSCRETQRKDAYKQYVKDMSSLATDSEGLGRRFNSLLTTRGKKESDVEAELTGMARTQKGYADRARGMDPPGRLRKQHDHAVEAFDLRVSGLDGMGKAFQSTVASKNAGLAGAELAKQMKRLVASDVVWEDLFKDPTKLVLKQQGITGAEVPDSMFLPNSDIATTASMKLVWQRIHGASTGGDGSCSPRGTAIISTKALPANQELSTSTLNTIQTSRDLRFEVTIEDSGCSQEVRIPVRLSIAQSGKPITAKQTIDLINPGEQKPVIFSGLPLPPLDQQTTVTVEVEQVPREGKVDNNTATYPATFAVQ